MENPWLPRWATWSTPFQFGGTLLVGQTSCMEIRCPSMDRFFHSPGRSQWASAVKSLLGTIPFLWSVGNGRRLWPRGARWSWSRQNRWNTIDNSNFQYNEFLPNYRHPWQLCTWPRLVARRVFRLEWSMWCLGLVRLLEQHWPLIQMFPRLLSLDLRKWARLSR